jgi:opacity protein-like surface antigen
MKKTSVLTGLIAPALLALSAPSAMAQDAYGELGYALMSTKLSVPLIGLSAKANPTMVRALVGVSPLGGLAIEGIASGSLSDDSFSASASGSTSAVQLGRAKVNQIFGVYVGSRLGLGPVEVYGRVGMAKSEVRFSGLGTGNETDVSYGGGLRLIPFDNVTLSADYMRYLDKDGARIEGYTLSVGYRF